MQKVGLDEILQKCMNCPKHNGLNFQSEATCLVNRSICQKKITLESDIFDDR